MDSKDQNSVLGWKMKWHSWWISGGAIAALFSCHNPSNSPEKAADLPYYSDASFTPYWFQEGPPIDFHQIAAFNLTNQEGHEITASTFENKIYVADFFFTSCPGICPKMTANMDLIQTAFLQDNEVLLVSHSVTPQYDSVSVLRSYASKHGIHNGKWHLVTGNRELIYDLGRNSYFVEEDLGIEKDIDDFLHTENFVLVDQKRHIRGIYNGLNKTSVQQLIADIRILKRSGI